MITFAQESIYACWDEMMVLVKHHWAGTKSYRRHEPLAPSRERYGAMEQGGYFHWLSARDQGALVGYCGLYITPSMHSQLLTATEDTFYLVPSHRGGRNALRFIQYIDAFCESRGVHENLFSCEMDNDSGIHGLLTLLKYRPVITMYSKLLDKPEIRAQNSSELSTPYADSVHDASEEVTHVRSLSAADTRL